MSGLKVRDQRGRSRLQPVCRPTRPGLAARRPGGSPAWAPRRP